MDDVSDFDALLARVRAGDQQAVVELVRQYEPQIRRAVRMRLRDKRLSRAFDSMDVCQSVFASFLMRAAIGEYDLKEPGQLIRLLATMAKNKLASAARREYQQKRDQRRTSDPDSEVLNNIAGNSPTASMIVSGRELIDRARGLLCEEELRIADLRAGGSSWDEVASALGGTAQARRVQLMRATKRIAQQLGLNDDA